MAVVLKIALLLIYLSVLFLLARLLEAVAWYEHGQISRRLLDPMALSVLKLKALLEQRGVSYDGVVEKSELKHLVEASGSINEEALEEVGSSVQADFPVTNFTGDADFYEQVEDAKDSMWLVEIVSDSGMLLSDTSWQAVRRKLGKFGVRFGRLDCQVNIRLCTRRHWFSSRLVLALPENYRSKANVALHTYNGPVKISSLFDWMKQRVNEQIRPIQDLQAFQDSWLNFDSALTPEVRMVFMSTMTSVPLFLSALSVKFPGRVKIGSIDTKTEKGKQLVKKAEIKNVPAYVLLTREGKYIYGSGKGEVLNFRAMEIFLKSFYPSLNDIFIISILCTNIAGVFEISLVKGTYIRRLGKLLMCLFKYNVILLLTWIGLLTLFQLPLVDNVCLLGLKLLRICASTMFFSFIRKDLLYYMSNITLPLGVAGFMICAVAFIKSRYSTENSDEDDENDWWNFSSLQNPDYEQWWELTRLRPFDQIFNPTIGILSVGGEVLDVHQTVISKDYIKHLPCWLYQDQDSLCPCRASEPRNPGSVECVSCRPEVRGEVDQGRLPESVCEGLANSLMDGNYRCECARGRRCPQHERPTSTCSHSAASNSIDETKDASSRDPFQEFTKSYTVAPLSMCRDRPEGYIEGSQCVICLENYQAKVLLRGLPCGHVFHAKCIGAWLMRDNHFCPVCRWSSNKHKEGGLNNSLHTE